MRFFAAILILLHLNFNAQERRLSLLMGPGVSSMRPSDGSRSRPGAALGIQYQHQVKPQLSVGVDLIYQRHVFMSHMTLTDQTGIQIGTVAIKERFQYLSLPVYARWNSKGESGFFVNGGFFLNQLLDARSVVPNIFGPERQTMEIKQVSAYGAGLMAGLGINVPMGKKLVFTSELRSMYGLTPALNSMGMDRYFNSFSLLAGLSYRFSTQGVAN